MKIVKKFQPKIVIFTAMKNRCMLNGRVFVMRRVHLFILEYLKQLKTVTQLMINKPILGLITRSFNQKY